MAFLLHQELRHNPMKITYQNKEIHFTTEGTGETLVLLHGFLESKEIWRKFIPLFSQFGQIIAIDLPGHGGSQVVDEIHTMELMAETVKAVLDYLGVEKANIIGHSMGGYVALAFLEQYPVKVGELMLLNSTPEEDSDEKKKNRERAIEVVTKNKKAYISMAISNLIPPENEMKFVKEVDLLKKNAFDFPTKGILAALRGMKIRTSKVDALTNFEGTKVIVAGEKDPLLELTSLKSIAKESNCRFYALPGGHLSYLESKDKFIKLCISSKK